MAQHHISEEITFHPEHSGSTRRIWVTLVILSVITLVELMLGLWLYNIHKQPSYSSGLVLFIKGAMIILTIAKAWYIVAVFMHLGDEIKNFVMTIIMPLTLFVWFIAAFIWDGSSWKNMRNTDAGSRPDTHLQQQHHVPPAAEKPGAKP